MDEIECLLVSPVVFNVIQLPHHILESPGWLNRAKIDADNGAILASVSHFLSPNAGPGADVKNSRTISEEGRCEVEFVVQH